MWQQGLQEWTVPWFEWILAYLNYYNPAVRVSSGYRSTTEQAKLYRRYLAGLEPGPVAPPGLSKHEQGLAIDVWAQAWDRDWDASNPPDELRYAGQAWEAAGGTWGGDFKTVAPDPIHFEISG